MVETKGAPFTKKYMADYLVTRQFEEVMEMYHSKVIKACMPIIVRSNSLWRDAMKTIHVNRGTITRDTKILTTELFIKIGSSNLFKCQHLKLEHVEQHIFYEALLPMSTRLFQELKTLSYQAEEANSADIHNFAYFIRKCKNLEELCLDTYGLQLRIMTLRIIFSNININQTAAMNGFRLSIGFTYALTTGLVDLLIQKIRGKPLTIIFESRWNTNDIPAENLNVIAHLFIKSEANVTVIYNQLSMETSEMMVDHLLGDFPTSHLLMDKTRVELKLRRWNREMQFIVQNRY